MRRELFIVLIAWPDGKTFHVEADVVAAVGRDDAREMMTARAPERFEGITPAFSRVTQVRSDAIAAAGYKRGK